MCGYNSYNIYELTRIVYMTICFLNTSLSLSLSLSYTHVHAALNAMIFADRRLTDQGLEQRLFFDNSMRSSVYSINITVDNDASVPECFNVTVFVSVGTG